MGHVKLNFHGIEQLVASATVSVYHWSVHEQPSHFGGSTYSDPVAENALITRILPTHGTVALDAGNIGWEPSLPILRRDTETGAYYTHHRNPDNTAATRGLFGGHGPWGSTRLFPDSADAFAIFLPFRRDNSQTGGGAMFGRGNNNDRELLLISQDGSVRVQARGMNNSFYSGLNDAAWHVVGLWWDGTTMTLRVDDLPDQTVTVGTGSDSGSPLSYGCRATEPNDLSKLGWSSKAHLGCPVIVDSALDAATRMDIMAELGSFYGLALPNSSGGTGVPADRNGTDPQPGADPGPTYTDARVDMYATKINGLPMPDLATDYARGQMMEHMNSADSNTFGIRDGIYTAQTNGAWSDPATWGSGTLPGAAAMVRVPAGVTVTYDVESEAHIKDIYVEGELRWDTTRDTKLRCDTIETAKGSMLRIGDPSAFIPESDTPGKPRAHIVFEHHVDPLASPRLGLMTMGSVRIHGKRKAHRSAIMDVAEGAASVFADPADVATWRVGDVVMIPATDFAGKMTSDPQYMGPTSYFCDVERNGAYRFQKQSEFDSFMMRSHDEVRTIVALDTVTGEVTLDAALDHAHTRLEHTLPDGKTLACEPIITSLSRSIRVESANPRGLRAHTMFMHNDDVDARFAEAKNMGRSKLDATLMARSTDVDPRDGVTPWNGLYTQNPDAAGAPTPDEISLADPTNVRGRYAWHVHRSGPFHSHHQVVFEGLTAWAPTDEVPQPGWAIVHHDSRCAFEKCVVYNVRGAGMVTENGSEIGQWIDNVVSWCRGDGFMLDWGMRIETSENHNGHVGVAFENQSRNILMQRNYATSSVVGYMYMQQNVENRKRWTDEHSLRLRDPITWSGMKDITIDKGTEDDDSYGQEQPQIQDWNDQVAIGCKFGLWIAHRQFTDRTDTTPMISKRFFARECECGYRLRNYSFWYYFFDFVMTGGGEAQQRYSAIAIGEISAGQFAKNGYVDNFRRIVKFDSVNFHGHMIDIAMGPNVNFVDKFYSQETNWDPRGTWAWEWAGPSYIRLDRGDGSFVWAPAGNDIVWTSADMPIPWPRRKTDAVSVGTPAFLTVDARTSLPSAANGQLPYFQLDAGTGPVVRLDLTQDGVADLTYHGVIWDSVGARRFPEANVYASLRNDPTANNHKTLQYRTNYAATGRRIVERNGCYRDANGDWKAPLWEIEVDRATGDYFPILIEVNLAGDWNEQLLADNDIGMADAARPRLPILPERIDPPS